MFQESIMARTQPINTESARVSRPRKTHGVEAPPLMRTLLQTIAPAIAATTMSTIGTGCRTRCMSSFSVGGHSR